MGIRLWRGRKKATAPLLEACAKQIPDPVVRLKFLRRLAPVPDKPKPKIPMWWAAVCAAVVLAGAGVALYPKSKPEPTRAARLAVPARLIRAGAAVPVPRIWVAEKTKDFEVYSNGLRIEN